MIITIPFKTPSVNHLYWHRGNIKILTKEARELQKNILDLVPECPAKDLKLKVSVEIYEDWICKNGSVARKDTANREKFLIDSVFKALKVDDKYIFEQHLFKRQSETEYSKIYIESL